MLMMTSLFSLVVRKRLYHGCEAMALTLTVDNLVCGGSEVEDAVAVAVKARTASRRADVNFIVRGCGSEMRIREEGREGSF